MWIQPEPTHLGVRVARACAGGMYPRSVHAPIVSRPLGEKHTPLARVSLSLISHPTPTRAHLPRPGRLQVAPHTVRVRHPWSDRRGEKKLERPLWIGKKKKKSAVEQSKASAQPHSS